MATKSRKVLVVISEPLLKRLDTAARKHGRNRSSELSQRLAKSLESKKQQKGATA